MTVPGAPLIYYGDEVGLLGETDPDCRRPMPWDRDRWSTPIFHLFRRLINLRKEHPCLRWGKREVLFFFNGVFAYRMSREGDEIIVVLNSRESVPDLTFTVPGRLSGWKDVETGRSYTVSDGKVDLGCMPSYSALVLVRSEEA